MIEAIPLRRRSALNDLLIAAFAVLANEIASHMGGCCCCDSWPWALPDPKFIAIKAHKKIQDELFEVYFRDFRGMKERLEIDYDHINLRASRQPMPHALPPAPAADIEAPADPAARE